MKTKLDITSCKAKKRSDALAGWSGPSDLCGRRMNCRECRIAESSEMQKIYALWSQHKTWA